MLWPRLARRPRSGPVGAAKRLPVVASETLVHSQKVIERMPRDRRTLAEVEECIEPCSLDQMENAGLWMLAWAHQDQATQLRTAEDVGAGEKLTPSAG